MISRVTSKIASNEKDISMLLGYITAVFKSVSRRAQWKGYGNVEKVLFPTPVATRFGTWLNAVSYLVQHWKALLDFLKGLDDCDSAVNAIEIMEKPDIIARIGYVHNVEFLCGYITESEARNYTIPKAEIAIQKMTEKLIDLANLEPKNPVAEVALNKLNEVVAKNDGLQKAAQLARGIGVTDPQQTVAYSFAPAQNIDVERLFSILNSFLSDRPNILDENVDKYMFLRYNSSI